MAKNDIQNVKIMANKVNLRATSLRAQLTNLVTMSKCGTKDEFDEAMLQFNHAIAEFKKAIAMN